MKYDRIGSPITVGEITIIPLVRVSIHHVSNDDIFTTYSSKEPVGIAICSPHRKWAIDVTDGKEMPIEQLYERFGTLQRIMDNL